MIVEALVAEAVKAVIGSLTKGAVGPALAAGGRVWAWLKTKLTGSEGQATVATVEANPAKPSARHKLSGALAEVLEAQPGLADELDLVLKDSGYREAVIQTANVTGNQNTTTQISGSGNTVAGERSVFAGRDMTGNAIATGDRAKARVGNTIPAQSDSSVDLKAELAALRQIVAGLQGAQVITISRIG